MFDEMIVELCDWYICNFRVSLYFQKLLKSCLAFKDFFPICVWGYEDFTLGIYKGWMDGCHKMRVAFDNNTLLDIFVRFPYFHANIMKEKQDYDKHIFF